MVWDEDAQVKIVFDSLSKTGNHSSMNNRLSYLMQILVLTFSCVLTGPTEARATAQAWFGVAPDGNRELLLSALKTAHKSIWMNAYELLDTEVCALLQEKVKDEGVELKLLIEGEPAPSGKMSEIEKTNLRDLIRVMKSYPSPGNELHIMVSKGTNTPRRFVYDHAKYFIVDHSSSWISSENFSPTSMPLPNALGNRGWSTFLNDATLASQLEELFKGDTDPNAVDILNVPFTQELPNILSPSGTPSPNGPPADDKTIKTIRFVAPIQDEADHLKLNVSPHSLPAFESFLASAKKSIDLEFMTLPSIWRISTGNKIQNPLITALITAAKRGVKVRVILNDDRIFDHATSPNIPLPNELAVKALNAARTDQVDIEARIIHATAAQITYIHNKGILVDDASVWIGSINGSRNSVEFNREIALQFDSQAASNFFHQAFNLDWVNSSKR